MSNSKKSTRVRLSELALSLIKRTWTRGAAFRDIHGVASTESTAVTWCAIGAIQIATSQLIREGVDYHEAKSAQVNCHDVLFGIVGKGGFLNIPCWNDRNERKHEEVICAFTKTAEAMRSLPE